MDKECTRQKSSTNHAAQWQLSLFYIHRIGLADTNVEPITLGYLCICLELVQSKILQPLTQQFMAGHCLIVDVWIVVRVGLPEVTPGPLIYNLGKPAGFLRVDIACTKTNSWVLSFKKRQFHLKQIIICCCNLCSSCLLVDVVKCGGLGAVLECFHLFLMTYG